MKAQGQSHWDTGSVIRLLAVLGSLGLYLSITQWAEHLEWAFLLILLGGLIGAIAGTTRFSFWESTGIAFVIGTSLIFLSGSSSLNIRANLLTQLFNFAYVINQGLMELIHHQPVSSSLLFLIAVMITCWYLGYFSGFALSRMSKPWIPIGLTAIAIIIIDLFLTASRRNGTISAIFFFFLIIILTRIFFSRSKEKWKKEKIHYDTEARFDFNRLVVIATLFIIIIAWIIPVAIKAFTPGTVEQLKFHAYVEKLTQQWNNLFAPLNESSNLVIYSYEDLLTIGNFSPSSEKTIFSVQTDSPPSTGTHYYWRARSYDSYDGMNWFNSGTSQDPFPAGSDLSSIPEFENSTLVKFSFRTNARIGIFFQGGFPGSVNQPGMDVYNPIPGDGKDIVAVLPTKIIENGASYSNNGWIVSPTISDMKSSSTIYPSWVKNRYLSISPTIPERIRELAVSITEGATDPYSKVEAITMYLRLNMHYSNNLQVLPEGRDLVDWFLFDSKKGFCSQYASAEVILLRSLGIPARLVAGYAQGAVSQNGKLYNVRVKDSHAWPEVYFANIGWVVFEPTVIIAQQLFPAGITTEDQITPTAKPTIRITAQSEAPVPTANQSNPIQIVSGTTKGSIAWFPIFIIGIGVLGVGTLILLFIKHQREKGIRTLPAYLDVLISSTGGSTPQWVKNWENSLLMQPIEKHFMIISWGLKKLHQPVRISETPQERIKRLIIVIPDAARPAQNLLREYEKSIYGEQEPSLKASQKSIHEIRMIIFRYRINRIFDRKSQIKAEKTR